MNLSMPLAAVLGLLLTGCALDEQARVLDEAQASYQAVQNDESIVRHAPKDVLRAGETLERAQRFGGYLGSREDVLHYSYLSQRYSQIAREHADLVQGRERLGHLQRQRERMQLALEGARMASATPGQQDPQDQLISLAATETDRGLLMTLGDVLFTANSTELSPAANRTLLRLVQFLQLNPKRSVRVEGYTDNRGDEGENQRLSQARAQVVADLLNSLGIDASRIAVVGYGHLYPLAENASARGRAQNRRVEILFSDDQGQLAPLR
ncbi:OmpA family protein [Pseudomonas sp. ABC1]|uniref:OmpA family protein n=1 Tax=Pseudomonas sp. ABC1 TaxID=2748080 RepID=UPI0015C2C4F4|nr:OmpA family protein [Pseudomonas sp. ABC1]QLF94334.1 OmpA family protein [Pseudomonas sp. ABC1]